jgi:uncharacterized protein Yka (UPF0111/DUF47 family)
VAKDKRKIIPMLEEASTHLPRGARALVQIAEASPEDRRPLLDRVESHELELEREFFEFLRTVSGTFITPFDRQDLVTVAKEMDDILGGVHEAADLLVRLQVGELPPAVRRLVTDVAALIEKVAPCVSLLKKPDKLSALWKEAVGVSNAALADYNQALAEIFDMDEDVRLLIKHKLVADRVIDIHAAVHRYLAACGVTSIKET